MMTAGFLFVRPIINLYYQLYIEGIVSNLHPPFLSWKYMNYIVHWHEVIISLFLQSEHGMLIFSALLMTPFVKQKTYYFKPIFHVSIVSNKRLNNSAEHNFQSMAAAGAGCIKMWLYNLNTWMIRIIFTVPCVFQELNPKQLHTLGRVQHIITWKSQTF